MRGHIALALVFALGISCVGDAFGFYSDNYRTTTVDVSSLNQHLIYRNTIDGGLYIKDAGRINDATVTAATVRPAATAIGTEINVFYVDAATGDLRRIVVTDATVPTATDTVFIDAATFLGGTPSALAVDELGTKLAVSIVDVVEIKRWDITDLALPSALSTIIPDEPTIAAGQQVCYKAVNSLSYDFPSSYDLVSGAYSSSLLAYGADSCIEADTGTCTCGASYSSVGVIDLSTVDTTLETSYPFASQEDSTVSYSFPAFDPFDNKIIVADETTATGNRVALYTVGSPLAEIANPGSTPGMPSANFDTVGFAVSYFNGGSPQIYAIDGAGYTAGNTEPANGAFPLVSDADMPVQVLDGPRPFDAGPLSRVPTLLDYGIVAPGEYGTLNLLLYNSGNLGLDILDITTKLGSSILLEVEEVEAFETKPVQLPLSLDPDQDVTLALTITPMANDDVVTEAFNIVTSWGIFEHSFRVDTGTGGTDPGDPGDPGEPGGVPHDEGEFIGPCFITELLK